MTAAPATRSVAARLGAFEGRLATTSAVITEAMHLLAADSRGPRALTDLASATRLEVHDLSRPAELHLAVDLMERYDDLPMDLADATLLLLAEGLATDDLLTLDRRGFAAFRTRDGRALRLVPDLA